MKKILSALLLISLSSGIAMAEARKHVECPLAKMKKCHQVCPEKMKGVQTVSKNTKKGVEITMTAKDEETIAKIQELAVVHYNAKETMEDNCPGRVAGAAIKLTNIKTGVKVDITGTTPEAIKKIQLASMKEHGGAPAAKVAAKARRYACPMKCATSDKPGKCPKCGMPMEEIK